MSHFSNIKIRSKMIRNIETNLVTIIYICIFVGWVTYTDTNVMQWRHFHWSHRTPGLRWLVTGIYYCSLNIYSKLHFFYRNKTDCIWPLPHKTSCFYETRQEILLPYFWFFSASFIFFMGLIFCMLLQFYHLSLHIKYYYHLIITHAVLSR